MPSESRHDGGSKTAEIEKIYNKVVLKGISYLIFLQKQFEHTNFHFPFKLISVKRDLKYFLLHIKQECFFPILEG